VIILSLGSNLGDREATLRAAVREIGELDAVTVVGASALVETAAIKPTGVDSDAPAYLNAIVAVESSLSPLELLEALRGIEHAHGRVRVEHWGDRTLDIDIVAFDDQMIESPELTIPHPRAAERAFVLAPWLEVDPAARLPGRGSVADLLEPLELPSLYAAEALL
jgi:2-amino-4-hydroxy-6-hydroxymethyldihydropteridine diphosphokinase